MRSGFKPSVILRSTALLSVLAMLGMNSSGALAGSVTAPMVVTVTITKFCNLTTRAGPVGAERDDPATPAAVILDCSRASAPTVALSADGDPGKTAVSARVTTDATGGYAQYVVSPSSTAAPTPRPPKLRPGDVPRGEIHLKVGAPVETAPNLLAGASTNIVIVTATF